MAAVGTRRREVTQWLEHELTDPKVRGSNPASASLLLLSRVAVSQPSLDKRSAVTVEKNRWKFERVHLLPIYFPGDEMAQVAWANWQYPSNLRVAWQLVAERVLQLNLFSRLGNYFVNVSSFFEEKPACEKNQNSAHY
ncbi:hypothetical protein CSKR_113605 [Clonorchis sinensis]|uniref:Uncharacterized protein n=1 Tax=Clonorchis sinensis TaxID=79923 RepID=A0A419Q239_CLOSI|nr:hypothetical protein CSKR_113605 [Clonorchis sinensis]